MKRGGIETAVGFFVIIGLICVGYLTIKLGKMEWLNEDAYPVFAKFQSVSGLKSGAYVEMAGVQIGKVDSITLDKKTKAAVVGLKIKREFELSDDVIASVATAGLIGDKYIKLSPGGSEKTLKAGDLITETESSVDLESLIGKYVFGGVKSPSLD